MTTVRVGKTTSHALGTVAISGGESDFAILAAKRAAAATATNRLKGSKNPVGNIQWDVRIRMGGTKRKSRPLFRREVVSRICLPPLFAHWINDDEERMNGLTMESIDIADMHYGCHAALIERELEAAVDSMSQDKRSQL